MKKTILLVLCLMLTEVINAGDVTPEQALQQAQSFLQQRVTSGKNRSQAAAELKMAGRVSGLYVFNADDDNGYVIVSNDDRTVSVLGYSDSGRLDLDNMPENMRAWLQGYADEIAWLDAHNYQPSPTVARRALSAVKQPIAPLISTRWNQGTPYNDLCPEYTSGVKSVTGCVATAMAQVMKFHEYAEMTGGLPAYDTDYGGGSCVAVAALPQTTFDWDNMLDEYPSGSYTAEQGAAVAKLMQYCGSSVKMNYGSSSSSNTNMVATALKDYFGYNSTTQLAVRSLYTYNEWLEIIYHELSENRPVVYGGQSSGGGHEFVCDGYQGEDYFHINWGWGGLSDNYFKLSVLNSDEQGIGGSSSKDGYHYGQDAVIGVQKPTDYGTVLSITPHLANLTVNSITCPATAAVGEEISVTLNIFNNSTSDYSGDIYLGRKKDDYYSLLVGDIFEIPAQTAKDCTFKLTFTSADTYQFVFFWPNEYGSYYTDAVVLETITVIPSGSGNPVTDNITLGRSLIVENSENTTGKYYNVYGSIFKGVLTVTNPETSSDYQGTYQCDVYEDGNYSSPVFREAKTIRVPASGSFDIPIEISGITNGSSYAVFVVYKKNGAWGSWDDIATYTCQPAVTTYAANGTATVTKNSSTSYAAPATALAVDLTGTTVTSVSGGATNCLFISDKSSLTGAANFVKNTSGTYTATSITLTDASDFFTPVDFTATNIEFTYNNDRWADGTNGWNTIMLPFDVTSVTANGTAIDWFHSSSDTGKQFWLKEFTADDTTAPKVIFDYVSGDMKANTPYIVALPGNHWGATNDLSGKTIKFIGENTTVHKKGDLTSVTGTNYRFVGTATQDATSNIYCINATGNKFELATGCPPFRAYFKPGIFDSSVGALSIGTDTNGTTEIITINNSKENTDGAVYDLSGRRVERPSKGVYIMNGKKIVVK
ncbi:MAG: hypothetical protein E7107_06955 [Prevotella sp.]|jgi:hypothetical protein|nr:hypothetical protein [Prevotella sp.]